MWGELEKGGQQINCESWEVLDVVGAIKSTCCGFMCLNVSLVYTIYTKSRQFEEI